jgi:hypothetical protein
VPEGLGLRSSAGTYQYDIDSSVSERILLMAQLQDLSATERAAKEAWKNQDKGLFLPEGTERLS